MDMKSQARAAAAGGDPPASPEAWKRRMSTIQALKFTDGMSNDDNDGDKLETEDGKRIPGRLDQCRYSRHPDTCNRGRRYNEGESQACLLLRQGRAAHQRRGQQSHGGCKDICKITKLHYMSAKLREGVSIKVAEMTI
jgi:hypothetical protein